MPTYHGATVKLRIERLAAEGKIQREALGVLSGGAIDQDFYTKNFPITTGAGVTTDTETDVDVYAKDPAGTTWVELDDDGSDFTIDGSEGLFTIQAAANQAGDAGKMVSISYYTAAYVGRGQGASIDYGSDLEDVHELGSRSPQELKEGHVSISGAIDALYVSRDLFGKMLGVDDFYGRLADFTLLLRPNGDSPGEPQVRLGNTKFSGGSIKVGLKAIMSSNVKFKGLAVELEEVPA